MSDDLADAFKSLPQRRILTVDIERWAGLAYRFDQRGSPFVPVAQWARRPGLLCFAAKWHDKREIEFHAAWNDEQAMVEASWELYDQADIVITYNGVRFDNKHLRTAWRDHGLPSPMPWKDVDLYKVNRGTFGAESYSLAELARQLGIPGKQGRYDPRMADACMAGDEQAQARMERYNKGDVRLTERVYHQLLPWVGTHPHVKLTEGDTLLCPRCGSSRFERLDKPYLAVVMEYAAYRCKSCKGIFRAGFVRRVAQTRSVR